MERVPRQQYTKEFREQAVQLVLEQQLTIPEAARRLSMSGKTLDTKRPAPGLIHHSDRGSQYCAQAYQAQLRQFGLTPSMSRKGNCYDNAPMESFWGTLKNELVHHRRYETREQARREITEYIELFYNRQRRHSRLGNRSPAVFAQQWARQQPAA